MEVTDKRKAFFEFLLGQNSVGFLCIAERNARTRAFTEQFFAFPDDLDSALKWIERKTLSSDVYFCPTLLREPVRKKEYVLDAWTAWADLDEAHPSLMLVEPTLIVETSPDRFQAFWRFEEALNPLEVEALNKRIAYRHKAQGADTSGWDLTQLLRVPYTRNHKYALEGLLPTVKVTGGDTNFLYKLADFDGYPAVEGTDVKFSELPSAEELAEYGSAEEILDRVRLSVNARVWTLVETEPSKDWSKNLWQLEKLLIAAGLCKEEVFIVAQASACNKYRRDDRPPELLWKEVERAWASENDHTIDLDADAELVIEKVELLTEDERQWCKDNKTIVDEYVEWAKGVGDAAWQYHQAGAFTMLSTMLAGTVRLPTSFGTFVPNLWFMILADTTLTRKTTAMDMAIDMLQDINPDCVLATDGSVEGLMTALSTRPGKPSIFLRDEFSGLLEMMTKKDYYAGMLETLTKLYDGKFQKKVLAKQELIIRDPVLIMLAGGIRDRMLQLFNIDHVNSGFIPRFIFITAESDVTRLRPLGPPTKETREDRDRLLNTFNEIYQHYNREPAVKPGSLPVRLQWDAELTDDAWVRFNEIEAAMLDSGLNSNIPDVMVPVMDRLCKSGLKAAVLLAAAQRLEDRIVVTEKDIVRAFYYVEQWREHSFLIVSNIGKTTVERDLEQVYKMVKRQPGIPRGHVMQRLHLTAAKADVLLVTLEQRGLIIVKRQGKTQHLFPTEA